MDGIQLQNITFRYGEDTRRVLENIDLFVEKGEFLTILGANGSGKSTLASLMNGIVLPTEVTVTVDGMDVTDTSKILEIRSSPRSLRKMWLSARKTLEFRRKR